MAKTDKTATKTAPAKNTANRANTSKTENRTAAPLGRRPAAGKTQTTSTIPAKRTGTAKRTRAARSGGPSTEKGSSNQARARPETAPSRAPLRPIRKWQSARQIIDAVAKDVGMSARQIERVARAMANTYTRHLMPGGSGLTQVPFLPVTLWRGNHAARPARTMIMKLPHLKGREVRIPAQKAMNVMRFRPHKRMREIVAGRLAARQI